jgi:peptidoglycan/LPS O-acetylase OafA/YrhL
LSVLGAHTQYWPKYFHGVGGLSAVEIFFVISGFYMSLVLSKTYKGHRRAFYINRILRIYPLFYIVLIATFILDIFQNSNFISSLKTLPNLGLLLVICSNLIIFGSDLLMFLSFQSGHLALVPFHQASTSLGGGLLVGQAWSLAPELAFYLFAPWLVLQRSKSLLIFSALTLTCKVFIVGLLAHWVDPWTYRFIGFEFPYFVIGMLVFRWWQSPHFKSHSDWLTSRPKLVGAITLVGFLSLPLILSKTAGHFGRIFHLTDFAWNYFVPLVIALTFAAIMPTLFQTFRRNPLDAKLGSYSYPIYISQFLVLSQVNHIIGAKKFSYFWAFLVIISFTFLTAKFLRHFESRIDIIRDRVRPKP